MTDPGMKCSRCRQPAQHRFPQHNARFCHHCLGIFIRRQAEKAIKKFHMLEPGQKVMAAISGGKDSLALWQILCDLGYETEGLHFTLGLGEFSARSLEASRAMAERLGRPLHVVDIKKLTGFSVEEVVRANRREFCSICGTLKRHFLNKVTLELGAEVLATGHHLDDEAGRLLGNLIRRHDRYLENQWPVLEGSSTEAGPALAKKIKPLCRLAGSEIKSYAKSLELPAAYGKCPKSKGATLPYYQEAMSFLDEKMPGTKKDFYLGWLKRKGAPPLQEQPDKICSGCGAPSFLEMCSACRILDKARSLSEKREEAEANPLF